jgi:protein-tyrosine-phosphatase
MLRILTVCTHNRTRSVVAAALLDQHLTAAGIDHEVASAGVDPAPDWFGHNPAISHLADHGIITEHQSSRPIDHEVVRTADVILTAEPEHVVWIAGQWPEVYRRTFTLPEAAEMTRRLAPSGGFEQWLECLASNRPPARTYLARGAIPMIADPTGQSKEMWDSVIATIDEDCRTIVSALE